VVPRLAVVAAIWAAARVAGAAATATEAIVVVLMRAALAPDAMVVAAGDARAARTEEFHVVHRAATPAIVLQERCTHPIQRGREIRLLIRGVLLLACLCQPRATVVPRLAVVAAIWAAARVAGAAATATEAIVVVLMRAALAPDAMVVAAGDARAARTEEFHVVHRAATPAIVLKERSGHGIQRGSQLV